MRRVRRSVAVAAVCAVAAAGLAACGSSNGKGSTSGASPSGGGTAKPFTYGYSIPTGQNPWINAIATAVRAAAAPAGGRMELTDAQLDPSKAVQQVGRFATEGVDAIAVAPAQVPEALIGPLAKAAAQGIHLFGLEWSFAADPTAPPKAPVEGQASIDRGKLGADVAAAVQAGAHGDAKVIYVGLPFPVASLDFFEASMKAKLGASRIVANLDNPTDNAQGALAPLNGALAAHPDANAIVTYNGPSALAAVQAVKSAGRQGKVRIYDIQIDSATAAAVRAGTIAAVWDLNPPALGKALGGLIAAAGSGKPKSAWAKTVVITAPEYTKATIGSWKDWSTGG